MLDALAHLVMLAVGLLGVIGVIGVAMQTYFAFWAICIGAAAVGIGCWRAVLWLGARLER